MTQTNIIDDTDRLLLVVIPDCVYQIHLQAFGDFMLVFFKSRIQFAAQGVVEEGAGSD